MFSELALCSVGSHLKCLPHVCVCGDGKKGHKMVPPLSCDKEPLSVGGRH